MRTISEEPAAHGSSRGRIDRSSGPTPSSGDSPPSTWDDTAPTPARLPAPRDRRRPSTTEIRMPLSAARDGNRCRASAYRPLPQISQDAGDERILTARRSADESGINRSLFADGQHGAAATSEQGGPSSTSGSRASAAGSYRCSTRGRGYRTAGRADRASFVSSTARACRQPRTTLAECSADHGAQGRLREMTQRAGEPTASLERQLHAGAAGAGPGSSAS